MNQHMPRQPRKAGASSQGSPAPWSSSRPFFTTPPLSDPPPAPLDWQEQIERAARFGYRLEPSPQPVAPAPDPIQMKRVETKGGTFEDKEYKVEGQGDKDVAAVTAHMHLEFMPSETNSEKDIGLVQTVKTSRTHETGNLMSQAEGYSGERTKLARMTEDGTHIDQSAYRGNTKNAPEVRSLSDEEALQKGLHVVPQTSPLYAVDNEPGIPDKQHEKMAKTLKDIKSPELYWANKTTRTPAVLKDSPGRVLLPGMDVEQSFEVAALTLSGSEYLGSVRWGYSAQLTKNGRLITKKDPDELSLAGAGNPSKTFLAAAKKWNEQKTLHPKTREMVPHVQLPIPEDPMESNNNNNNTSVRSICCLPPVRPALTVVSGDSGVSTI
jgi:hypothetical protein